MEPVFDGWPPGGPGAREPVGRAIKGERVDVKSHDAFLYYYLGSKVCLDIGLIITCIHRLFIIWGRHV